MYLLRGLLDGSVETDTLNGREYVIVPVVAMVEGVRHAANAANPELVPVSAFGRVPDSWNGRPVVVDHPSDSTGNMVSASKPEVLTVSYLGTIMNARVDGTKLRVEAWIDVTGAASSDAVSKMLARIANEETIEVSVGAYVITRQESGTFMGEEYKAVWELCIPDHLAFLSSVEGACSIADGCGTFRTDAARALAFSTNARAALAPIKERTMTTKTTCTCQHEATAAATTDEPSATEQTSAAGAGNELQLGTHEGIFDRFCLANGMHANDVRTLLANAIDRLTGYHYLISFSDTHVVYEGFSDDRYAYLQRSYSIGSDNVVTLGDDIVEVIPMTRFVEVPTATQHAAGDSEEKGSTQVADENAITVARDASVEDALKAFEGTTFGRQLSSALSVESDLRNGLVTKVLAAPGNTLTEAQLKELPTDALKGMAAIADANKPADTAPAKDAKPTDPAPVQHGRGGGAGDQGGKKAPEAPKVFDEGYLAEHRKRMRA
jgi:hypothetical protein